MKITIAAIVCIVFAFPALSQDYKITNRKGKIELLKPNENWSEGTVTLSDGQQRHGLVRYNEQGDYVSLTDFDGENNRTYSAREILQVTFQDDAVRQKRTFYSLPLYPNNEKEPVLLLCELLKEYKRFAFFSRIDPLAASVTYTSAPTPQGMPAGPGSSSTDILQVESILIVGESGNIEFFAEERRYEDGRKSIFTGDDRKSSTKFVNEKAILNYVTKEDYEALRKYASKHKLDPRTRTDLLKILEYYDTLIN